MALSWSKTGNLYVAKLGNDGNPGTDVSPKLTIGAAVAAATTGQTIVVASGVYAETVTCDTKSLTFEADGTVTVTGTVSCRYGYTLTVTGFIFSGVGAGLTLTNANAGGTVIATKCTFSGCTVGIGVGWSSQFTATDCLFVACVSGMRADTGSHLTAIRCTFVGCTNGAFCLGTYGNPNLIVQNSLFSGNTHHLRYEELNTWVLDYCDFTPLDASHDLYIVATTYTSYAALQAAGYNTNGVSQAASFGDAAISEYSLDPNDTLLVKGVNHERIGSIGGALVLSPNKNAATWNAPYASSNAEQDGDNYWRLTAAGEGYVEHECDFGGPVYLHEIENLGSESGAAQFDEATGDYFAGYTYRSSLVSQADMRSQGWTEGCRNRSLGLPARWLSVRSYLRTNGDLV